MRNSLTLAYNIRHLAERKIQTAMTLGGIALVVFVFVATLMLSEGLRKTLVSTGSPNNVLAVMTGAQGEVQSGISREAANVIMSQPEVNVLPDGRKQATSDLTVLITLKKRSDGQTSNVTVRGITRQAWDVRPQVKLAEGRLFNEGTQEIIVGQAVRRKFANTNIGDKLQLFGTQWTVVGVFDAGATAFSSEAWGDVNVLMPACRREQFSSVSFKLAPGADYDALKQRLEKDPRLSVTIERERDFYEGQSRDLGNFIRYLGTFVSIVFSLGAMIGATITMFSSVASRTREIGILRALGFSRSVIFTAFLRECLVIGALGAVVGVACASALTYVTFATTNFTSFADLAFGFRMTPGIAAAGMLFALLMSVLGGALPAWKAARMDIVSTMRAE